jgi:DNA repair exonuclease SbcCD ATPase subunit
MNITRLRLSGFRRHDELDVALRPGLNIVRGPNEAGKSTIQRAIELAITRRVTSGANDLNAFRPWDAAPDARTVISLEFEQDEEDTVKAGTLEKVFGGTKGTVDLRYDGQTISDPTLCDQVLAELTGIPTEAFFRSSWPTSHATSRPCATGSRPRSAAPTAAPAAPSASSAERSTSS